MIHHISIKNFAIIEHAEVDFHDGLNIVTGETGSGKSILIEAVSLALGSRADSSCIRTGCDKAVVQLLGELNGEEILITREVSASGKNLCKLNGELVTLAQLNQVCSRLADIHGQYDNQSLLDPDCHITLLDAYRSELTTPAREETTRLFHLFAEKKRALSSLLALEKENARKRDFYRFEIDEIDKADPTPGEDETLADKISVLQNSEKIYEGIERTYTMLFEENPSVMDGLGAGLHALEGIAAYSKELETRMHQTIKKVSSDFETLKYNTAIAAMMSLINDFYKAGKVTRDEFKTLLILLNPVAPHMTEELWQIMNYGGRLYQTSWPTYEEAKTVESEVEIAVQVNGKVRATIKIAADISKEDAIAAGKAAVADKLTGQIVKEIYVPGRLVNIVQKG